MERSPRVAKECMDDALVVPPRFSVQSKWAEKAILFAASGAGQHNAEFGKDLLDSEPTNKRSRLPSSAPTILSFPTAYH